MAQLIGEWPRPAQCQVLAFALALPPSLVSDFWRVLWTADAATSDTDLEERVLGELRQQIAAREAPAEPSSAA